MPDIITSLATHYGQIRLEIGDTDENEGPFPNGRNFSDAELDYFYVQENTSVGRSAARAAEVLARAWASAPKEETLGPHKTKTDAVKHWQAIAARLRLEHGSSTAARSFNGRLKIMRVGLPE